MLIWQLCTAHALLQCLLQMPVKLTQPSQAPLYNTRASDYSVFNN